MGSWLGPLQNAGRVLLDFAYPPHCVVCQAEIEAVAILCDTWWLAIEKAKANTKIQCRTICCLKVICLNKI